VSRSADSPSGADADPLGRLEEALDRALARIRELEAGLADAHSRARELDDALKGVTGGELEPSVLMDRVGALEGENEELRSRLAQGREGIERLLARIRFIEERR
jgi:hypothetical protein